MPHKTLLKLPSFLKGSKLKYYLLILFITGLLFTLLVFINMRFQLKTITIEGDLNKEKLVGLESIRGTNLLFMSEAAITDSLSKNNPTVQFEQVRIDHPNHLYLKIKQSEPLAQIALNQGYAELSQDGKILKKAKVKFVDLPVISFYQKFDYYQLGVGNNLNYQELLTALYLLQNCQDLGVEVESIDITGLSMIVFNLKVVTTGEQAKKILLSAEKDKEKLADELTTLLTHFKIKAQDFKVLDLRFEKPVVKF